jgi:hypothetical protein
MRSRGQRKSLSSFSWIAATVLSLISVSWASAQLTTAPASATPAGVSSGRPSTFTVRQNILLQQQAALEAQIKVASLCIADASKPQMLRDPEGNINPVPQKDIINCARQLRTLTRKLAGIGRQLQKLAADAQAAAAQLQTQQQTAQRMQRTQWVTGGGTTRRVP